MSFAVLGRQIRYSNTSGFQQAAWGGSVSLAGKINTFGLDNIRFMTHYGNGHGRYMTTPNTFADAALNSSGSLDLVTAYGAMLSYQHWWSKQWRSSLTYGFAQADQPSYVNSVLNRQVQSIHVNLLWSPISQAMMGVEYIYATRELLDGRAGDLQRLQFSALYNF
ncbi:MAG: DcaP family trimeric outer membrane transporter [Methylococcaceae bacterium]